jgi:hypothetical protein
MASSGKKKTTMAKLTRESRLRERRLDKQARKDARKRASALDPDGLDPYGLVDTMNATTGEPAQPDAGLTALDAVAPALGDA